ncbi:Myrcene synthase, chloroplastic [Morella rubra]|uniref:Myrcene synthase, chloroplastic n=1 Tax=Morella rubra TaxID=262757 RepID=A0A6A1V0K4_9ROSI|nr:Myrcene synthase, chloroplastic [Morella rubra]
MALSLLASVPNFSFPRLTPSKIPISLVTSTRTGSVPTFQCKAATTKISSHPVVARRSGNYQPTIWHYDYIESLRSEYAGESCNRRIDKLKGDVRMMLDKVVDPLEQLELIDILQRLGLSYHFEDEISRILEAIYTTNDGDEMCNKENLYATTLKFRLLRQHRYSVPQEIFNIFKNEKGTFKACLIEDIEGLLCLYEASFLLIEGESILEEARDFATKQLEEYVEENKDGNLSAMVSHALELPLRWRMPRVETRWFINEYRRKEDMNPILLELAELDFNMVQAAHQEDLKDASRRMLARAIVITTIDDVYDVYGTLEELELFTDAVDRWDTNVDHLPYYMQICFHALHNSVNEMAFDFLKEQQFHIVRYLKKAWANLYRSYLLEVKWYNIEYTPTLQEYIDNAWITISGPLLLLHAYFFVTNPITKEVVDYLEEYPNIIRWSSIIFRLANDLGTSKGLNGKVTKISVTKEFYFS